MIARFFSSLVLPLTLSLVACSGSADDPPGEVTAGSAGAGPGGASGGGAGEAGSGGSGQSGTSGQGAGAGQAGSAGAAADWQGTPYAAAVVSFTPGPDVTFGQEDMPGVVLGPPEAAPTDTQGGLDVVSLGVGGELVLELGLDVVDGPGVDLIVFENPFYVGASKQAIYKELGEVSVSLDGVSWTTFVCDPATYTTSQCAGWRVVLSSPGNGIAATDPAVAGGDPFDLAQIGVARARYVKIRDLSKGGSGDAAGFDLDAVAVVNAATP